MAKTWADVETAFKDAGISYSLRSWLYTCQIKGREFYYSAQTGKWRVKGKRVWHKSDSPRDFMARALRYSEPESQFNQSQGARQKTEPKSSKQKTQTSSSSEQRRQTGKVDEIRAAFLEQFGEYLQQQRERHYKIGWIWHCLLKEFVPTPPEICWVCVVLKYSPWWAFHQIKGFYSQANREQIFSLIDSHRDNWLKYFQQRWGVSEDNQTHKQQRASQRNESNNYALIERSCLEILRVSFPFTKQELKSAYRKRALETHPDSGGTASAFREVNTAYQTLSRYI